MVFFLVCVKITETLSVFKRQNVEHKDHCMGNIMRLETGTDSRENQLLGVCQRPNPIEH